MPLKRTLHVRGTTMTRSIAMRFSRNLLLLYFGIYLFLSAGGAHATDADVFPSCLKRTQKERSSCQSGCGMLLQSCYDEAVTATNNKADQLISRLQGSHAQECTDLAMKYSERASKLGNAISEGNRSRPGWLSAELDPLFAQQRLATLQVIQRRCH